MARPIIGHITPFDANKDNGISFSWMGNRSHANRLIIYDNETNDLVFDDTVSTYALSHTIPAHTLTNGKKYVIQAQTYDAESTASPLLLDGILNRAATAQSLRNKISILKL